MSRRYGVPKTEQERRKFHEGKYGGSELPERGTGLKDNPITRGEHLSFTQRLIANLQSGFLRFLSVIVGANRDLPYHDYETATTTSTYKKYTVGENNIGKRGSQSKLFVSKSTLIYSTTEADVKFNDTDNVGIDILADVLYTFESNIHAVFYKYSSVERTIHT